MNDCFYCENGEKLNSLMIEVCKLDYSTVYLNRDQKHKGRCIVMFKDHKTEYFQLTQEENRGYFAELAKTAQAVWNLYHPDKINYATFGDGVPHVHVHVVPKYKGGLQSGEAFHDDVEKVLLSEEEYQEMAKALREEIRARIILRKAKTPAPQASRRRGFRFCRMVILRPEAIFLFVSLFIW